MQLILNKIAITGFRGYKEIVEYNLGYRTLVQGDNGLGKSTIKEAFVWCLTGCDSSGNEKATTKLVNDSKPKYTEVAIDLTLDEEPQTIIRRKKGSTNTLYWNEKKVNTSDIAREIFQNKNVFLSIVNPYYFPSLAPKDAKALLSDVLKPVSREEIFKELGDYLKKVMLDNGFRIPETFLSDCRDNLKEQEQNITYLEGKIDGLKLQDVPEKLTFDKQEELDSLKKELSNVQAPTYLNAQLKELDMEEKSAVSEFKSVSYQPLKDITVLKKQREMYLSDYKSKKSKLDGLESNYVECQNCHCKVDTTNEIRSSLNSDIREITARGKEVAEEIKKDETYNQEVNEKNIKIREQKKQELDEKLAEINTRREEIKLKVQKQEEEYEKATVSLQDKINALEEEKKQIDIQNKLAENIETNNASIKKTLKECEEGVQNSKNKIAQLKLAIDAGKQYNSIKLKKQAEQIEQHLDKVTIQFEKLTKDGEIKDKFEVLYDGKEFGKLSGSERIKAGLEVSNLLMNVSKMQIPVFVDDAESINNIPELNTQMIVIKVTEDKEIKVKVEVEE